MPVPSGITHLEATYTTTRAIGPNSAALDETPAPVAFTGGEVDVVHDLVASCDGP
ncbi:MAG: hypothetical protein R2697_02525 [Ilumatobacteraceae bacterium]